MSHETLNLNLVCLAASMKMRVNSSTQGGFFDEDLVFAVACYNFSSSEGRRVGKSITHIRCVAHLSAYLRVGAGKCHAESSTFARLMTRFLTLGNCWCFSAASEAQEMFWNFWSGSQSFIAYEVCLGLHQKFNDSQQASLS